MKIELKKANEKNVGIANKFLTMLIKDEQQYDENIKNDFEMKSYYENLITQFIELIKLPDSAHLAMQLLPEFKITVPALLDGMAYRAVADKNPKACVFAAYMIDQSLLQRDMTPLFNVIIEFGTPELWVELVKKVNNAPADRIVEKVYQCDKSVQTYWEQQIL